jgi:hypothetical protein
MNPNDRGRRRRRGGTSSVRENRLVDWPIEASRREAAAISCPSLPLEGGCLTLFFNTARSSTLPRAVMPNSDFFTLLTAEKKKEREKIFFPQTDFPFC